MEINEDVDNNHNNNDPPYECNINYLNNQKTIEKYQTWLDECDLQESIDIYNKGLDMMRIIDKSTCHISVPGLIVLGWKLGETPNLSDLTFFDYLLTKNKNNIIPLVSLNLTTNNVPQQELDQGYKEITHLCDGIIGINFDKPLESDFEITFHVLYSNWKQTLIIPQGTVNYKLPKFLCSFWIQRRRLLVKGLISGSNLLGTFLTCNDRHETEWCPM